jgi:hypothetical protein
MVELLVTIAVLAVFLGALLFKAYRMYKSEVEEFFPHAIGGMSPLGKSDPPSFFAWFKYKVMRK